MNTLKITPRQYKEMKELAEGEYTREVKLRKNLSLYFNASQRILFVDTPFVRSEYAGMRVTDSNRKGREDEGCVFFVDGEGATRGRMTFVVGE